MDTKIKLKYNEGRRGVWFVNPKNNEKYKAEKFGITSEIFLGVPYNTRLSGFSLLGSLLESYYSDFLKKPIPPKGFCCKNIPIKVVILIIDGNDKVNYEISRNFKIYYK